MKKLLVILFMVPLFATAQQGIEFVHGMSWKEIQAKAKAENKYIFLDGWTTWCGPCIYMAKNIFPMENVGTFFNKNFINVKMQLDTSKKDSEETKALYQDAHDLMVKYDINVFPTYLFIGPDGKLVHRAVGASDADKFLAKASDALNPEKQYYTLLGKYRSGNKDNDLLRRLAIAADDAADRKISDVVSTEYLQTQTDLLTEDNIAFIERFTRSSKSPGFKIMIENSAMFDGKKGAGFVSKRIVNILLQEKVYATIFAKNAAPADWTAISKELEEKYPAYAQEVLSTAKVTYYQRTKNWDKFQVAVVDYMKSYGANSSPDQLNNFAWTVFENCKDMTCVKEALEWSRRSFKDKEDPMFMDTYANILYKLGKKDEAIKWQEKAIALVPESDRKDYQETLDKMKKGEKTWKD